MKDNMTRRMTRKYNVEVILPDPELETVFIREMCRELIMEDIGSIDIDEAIFEEVMRMIQGDTGTQNMFDAPILYTLVGLRKPSIKE